MSTPLKLSLKFQEEDFASFRSFEAAVKKQTGPEVYVGTDFLCLYYPYPKALVERLRPLCSHKQLEFDLTPEKPDAKRG